MAFPRTQWYVNSVGYAATTAWATGATIAAGALRRPTAPAVGSERIVVAIVGGTTNATTEPTWTTTRGAKNTDNTVTWQECTGQAAVNGDLTNTVAWNAASVKNTALTQGTIIKDVAGTHLFILSTAGTAGNGAEPTWNVAAVGNTTADNTCTWTYIGLASSFTGGLAPFARLATALASTWGVAGDTICVGDNHAETQATTVTIANSSATPFYVLCHNHSGSYPPASADLTTGATMTETGGLVNIDFTASAIFFRGVEFIANNSSSGGILIGDSGSSGAVQRFDNCKFTVSNAAAGNITVGSGTTSVQSSLVNMKDCSFSFAATSQGIVLSSNGVWRWENNGSTGLTGAIIPSNLILSSSKTQDVFIRGVDLSAAGSGKNLFSATRAGRFTLMNCKLNASVTIMAAGTTQGTRVEMIDCDSGAINYRNEVHDYRGDLTTETTIVRSGGASDGTTPISNKVVTTANPIWAFPFELPPIAIWNEATSSLTVTLFGIWGGGAVPNNDDFWIDVTYLGSSLTPITSIATSGKADFLASNSPLSSDASSWGGSTTAFKTSVTITPGMKGYIFVTPKMAKASTTLYYDPKLSVA